MKIVFGILASHNENYNLFKNVWIKFITKFKNSQHKDLIDFFFLYSENTIPTLSDKELQNRIDANGNRLFYDYYSETENEEIMESFVRRSLSLLKHLDQSPDGLPTYFIRTNISTLFDFEKMISWLNDKPRNLFLGGSIVDNIFPTFVCFSGTNLIFSKDVCKFIINHENFICQRLNNILGDDRFFTHFIIQNLPVSLCSVKRIDFIDITHNEKLVKIVNYHKCTPYDTNIFCFRFKTSDRLFDIDLMNKMYNLIETQNFDLNNFTKNTNLTITCSIPEYDILSDNIFKIKV